MSEETVTISAKDAAFLAECKKNRAPLHKPFVCPGCKEQCPFPTQVFDGLKAGEDPSERMVTCGCGMTHKLTMATGAVSEMPEGVACDTGWRAKLDAKHRAARDAEMSERIAKAEAHVKAGRCPHCEGTGKVGV